jgi:hypothetical protein
MRYKVVLNVYLFRSLKLKNLGCQELLDVGHEEVNTVS